ncbi:MAG: chorismate mutase [Alkaliphilus sp.]
MILAIRGATTSNGNSVEEISECTTQMMKEIIESNNLNENDVISILFTATSDLDQQYPSICVREDIGWTNTPILNFEEKNVLNSMKNCIRVLIYFNSNKDKTMVNHVYLNGAKKLRTDLLNK